MGSPGGYLAGRMSRDVFPMVANKSGPANGQGGADAGFLWIGQVWAIITGVVAFGARTSDVEMEAAGK